MLHDRIDRRVDAMMEMGLLEETKALLAEGVFDCNPTAAQAIGYKELFGAIRGECTLEQSVALLKTATAQYAKRQMTWFRGKDYVCWIRAQEQEKTKTFEEIVNNASLVFLK